MKWLITGGCGFIGVNLLRHLLDAGDNQIRVFDNLSVGTKHDLDVVLGPADQSKVELVVGDIKDPEQLKAATQGLDALVHLAANTGVAPSVENPTWDCQTNVRGTLNVLEAARANNVPRVVFASSGAPLGEQEPPIHEEKVPKPISPYGASKLAGESYCRVYSACFGVKTTALRFSNVYGPYSRHKQSLVANLINRAFLKKPLIIYGDGNQTRDFIFVKDLVRAISCGVDTETSGEVFQVATAKESSVNQIVELLVELLEPHLDNKPEVVHEPPRVGDVTRNFADVSKAKAQLGWSATHTLRDGLAQTVKWFVSKRR